MPARVGRTAGNVVVLIVGDYTARIGDPSGRSSERPVLADEELDTNANLSPPRPPDPRPRQDRGALQRDGSRSSASPKACSPHAHAHRLAPPRARRLREALRCAGADLLSELLYPPMQGYDSVAIDADVEIGGTDQLYNLLTGPRRDWSASASRRSSSSPTRYSSGSTARRRCRSPAATTSGSTSRRRRCSGRRCRSPTRRCRSGGSSSPEAASIPRARWSGSSSSPGV